MKRKYLLFHQKLNTQKFNDLESKIENNNFDCSCKMSTKNREKLHNCSFIFLLVFKLIKKYLVAKRNRGV